MRLDRPSSSYIDFLSLFTKKLKTNLSFHMFVPRLEKLRVRRREGKKEREGSGEKLWGSNLEGKNLTLS
jgi:hypothetical protein